MRSTIFQSMCVFLFWRNKSILPVRIHRIFVSQCDSIQFASHLTRKSIAFITLHDLVFEYKTATVFANCISNYRYFYFMTKWTLASFLVWISSYNIHLQTIFFPLFFSKWYAWLYTNCFTLSKSIYILRPNISQNETEINRMQR